MRKVTIALAVLSLAAVGLVGCSSTTDEACSRPVTADRAALEPITVSGPTDSVPDVNVYAPFNVTTAAFEDAVVGDGTAITDDSQLVVVDISLSSGATGEKLVSTPYDGDLSRVYPVSRWIEAFPAFEDALHCAAEGSRVVVALPPGGIEQQTATSLGLTEKDSAVAVVDVRKVYLPHAEGDALFNDGHGLPTVVRAPNGRPGIIIPEAAAPTELAVQTLIKGEGPVVGDDDTLRVHYTGLTWGSRTPFETTWDGEPKSVTPSSMIPGFAEALKGQTVGSQVMVVIPPDQGYGDKAQGAIPANSTLVFVVDILGIDSAPAK